MLVRETVAVYCENHTEHINTLCGQNAETLYIRIQFVPHRKHHVFIIKPLQTFSVISDVTQIYFKSFIRLFDFSEL
jgi:hypothetical protein